MLRHMAVDYMLRRLSGSDPPPAGSSGGPRRPSLFETLRDDLDGSAMFGRRHRANALRASDADREEVVSLLNRHFAEGRLNTDELSARVESAYGARSVGELAPLTRDLPEVLPPAGAPLARSRARTRPVIGVAALSMSAFLVIVFASLMPAEVWAPLAMLLFVLVPLALVMLLPIALFALPLLWLRGPRALTSRAGSRHGHLIVSETRHGWVGVRRR